MNELDQAPQDANSTPPLGEVPILEKHKHPIAIGLLLVTVLLGGVYFFNFNSIDTQIVTTEEEISTPVAFPEKELCTFPDDVSAYDKARETADVAYCECVKDNTVKNTCLSTIKDLALYNNAIKQMNPDLCEEIAIDAFKTACKQMVSSSVAYFEEADPQYLANTYAGAHNDKAIEKFEKLLETDAANVTNLINLTLAYAEKGLSEQEQGRDQTPYVEKALATIEKAKTLEQNNSNVYRALGYVYEIKPEYEKALQAYNKAIELDPKNIMAYAGRGHVDRMLGVLTAAIDNFNEAAKLDTEKKYTVVYTNLCNLQYTVNLVEDAIKNCTIVTDQKDADNFSKAEAYQIMATIYMENKKYAQANSALLSAKTLHPNDANLYVTLSKLNIFEENYSASETNARKAIELSSTKATGYLALSHALYMQEKFEASIEAAEKGISLIPNDVSLLAGAKNAVQRSLYYSIANNYRELGNVKKQEEYVKKAEEILTGR